MPETILCPSCARRLQVAADFQAELVRCPSCDTTFALASARQSAIGYPLSAKDTADSRQPIADSRQPIADAEPDWREATAEREPTPPRRRRSSPSTILVAAVVVGAVLLFLGLAVTAIVLIVDRLQPALPPVAARIEEDEEERRQQLREAFKDQKPLADKEIAQQAQSLFDELADAILARNADRIMACFDADRMLDESIAAGGTLRIRTARERRGIANGMRLGIGRSLVQKATVFHWNATEIRRIQKLNNNEVVLIVRHTHPNGGFLKMRWWLTRREGGWKVYDFEDLDVAGRISSEIAALLGQGPGRVQQLARSMRAIGEAIQLVAAEDVDGAEKKLAEVPPGRLPPRYEGLRQLARGMILLHREKYDESLKALEEAARLHGDMPITDLLRGQALNRLGKAEPALKHLQAYRDLLGEDSNVCREIGEAYQLAERLAEAAGQYRKALDFNPRDAEAFAGLLRSLDDKANRDDLGPRFARLDNLRENFDVFAADCEEREIPELLAPLVQTMRKLDPTYPPVDYYQALVQARTGHPDEAVRSLRSALRRQTDPDERQEYEEHFLAAMAAGGHYSKAYAAASDARKAFHALAAEARKHYQMDELKRLIAAHAGKHTDDPLLPLYQAEVHVRDGQYEKADQAFTKALAQRPDAELLKTFRASRVLARYHIGQAMAAYRDIGPREETFAQLASLFFQDEKDDDLLKLLDTHAKKAPDNLDGIRFRYRLLIRQNRTAEGVALFRSAVAKGKNEEEREELVSEFLSDMVAAEKPLEGYRAAPDAEDAFRELADSLLEDESWDDLRQLVQAHRAAHADDPWLAYYEGEVLCHDEAWEKVVQVMGEALKRAPDDVRTSMRNHYVFALYELGRWEQAYAEVEPHDDTFAQLANLMANDRKAAELEALIRVHRPHAKDALNLLFQEARAKVLMKKWDEAAALFQQAYRKQTNETLRYSYQSMFLSSMAEAEQWLAGYRAAVDKNQALHSLAGRLVNAKKQKELAALLEEHRKNGASEPWYS